MAAARSLVAGHLGRLLSKSVFSLNYSLSSHLTSNLESLPSAVKLNLEPLF